MSLVDTSSGIAVAPAGPSGLSSTHQVALNQAAQLLSAGHAPQTAVDHLVAADMPRMVAKVLVKQFVKRAS